MSKYLDSYIQKFIICLNEAEHKPFETEEGVHKAIEDISSGRVPNTGDIARKLHAHLSNIGSINKELLTPKMHEFLSQHTRAIEKEPEVAEPDPAASAPAEPSTLSIPDEGVHRVIERINKGLDLRVKEGLISHLKGRKTLTPIMQGFLDKHTAETAAPHPVDTPVAAEEEPKKEKVKADKKKITKVKEPKAVSPKIQSREESKKADEEEVTKVASHPSFKLPDTPLFHPNPHFTDETGNAYTNDLGHKKFIQRIIKKRFANEGVETKVEAGNFIANTLHMLPPVLDLKSKVLPSIPGIRKYEHSGRYSLYFPQKKEEKTRRTMAQIRAELAGQPIPPAKPEKEAFEGQRMGLDTRKRVGMRWAEGRVPDLHILHNPNDFDRKTYLNAYRNSVERAVHAFKTTAKENPLRRKATGEKTPAGANVVKWQGLGTSVESNKEGSIGDVKAEVEAAALRRASSQHTDDAEEEKPVAKTATPEKAPSLLAHISSLIGTGGKLSHPELKHKLTANILGEHKKHDTVDSLITHIDSIGSRAKGFKAMEVPPRENIAALAKDVLSGTLSTIHKHVFDTHKHLVASATPEQKLFLRMALNKAAVPTGQTYTKDLELIPLGSLNKK